VLVAQLKDKNNLIISNALSTSLCSYMFDIQYYTMNIYCNFILCKDEKIYNQK
jgi:hypothetical protein